MTLAGSEMGGQGKPVSGGLKAYGSRGPARDTLSRPGEGAMSHAGLLPRLGDNLKLAIG